jgi:phosphatidylserine decarboxylase
MIQYWDREKQKLETELVYGDAAVSWLYGNPIGRALADGVLTRTWFSKLYGSFQSSPGSRKKIAPFIETFKIPMNEYEERDFVSFNDFFSRRFRPGMRPFVADPKKMGAFAEARYLGFERVAADQKYPVKGQYLTAHALLEDAELAKPFEGGAVLIARLCPTDYHRFHFPDDGKILENRTLPGKLHSVNPLALQHRGEIFATNERQVSILETEHFGKLAYIEVGAICVGKIVQTDPAKKTFRRGDEKGYFLFGASTVIVLGEPGKWRPERDLLEQTAQQRECYLKLGAAVATA